MCFGAAYFNWSINNLLGAYLQIRIDILNYMLSLVLSNWYSFVSYIWIDSFCCCSYWLSHIPALDLTFCFHIDNSVVWGFNWGTKKLSCDPSDICLSFLLNKITWQICRFVISSIFWEAGSSYCSFYEALCNFLNCSSDYLHYTISFKPLLNLHATSYRKLVSPYTWLSL